MRRDPETGSRAQEGKRGFVYFILARCSGFIKIGFTGTESGVRKRLSDAQTYHWEELELLGYAYGTRGLECDIHDFYAFANTCRGDAGEGEWFDPMRSSHLKRLARHVSQEESPMGLNEFDFSLLASHRYRKSEEISSDLSEYIEWVESGGVLDYRSAEIGGAKLIQALLYQLRPAQRTPMQMNLLSRDVPPPLPATIVPHAIERRGIG